MKARIEILAGQPDEAEIAAIVAAVLTRRQPPAEPVGGPSAWQRAARLEAQRGMSALQNQGWLAPTQPLWHG